MRVQLGGAAGQVQQFHALPGDQRQHLLDRFPAHGFGAVGAGIDVAVDTAEIADIAQVDLQRLHAGAVEVGEITFQQ